MLLKWQRQREWHTGTEAHAMLHSCFCWLHGLQSTCATRCPAYSTLPTFSFCAGHRLFPAHCLPVCPCCLPCRLLLNNSLSGSLPEAWVGLSTLRLLDLTGNRLEGSLPEGWAAQGAMPQLRTLILAGNAISGKLPGAWARPEALPALSWLDMSFNIISGGLPDEWGMPNSFPRLRLL